MAPTFPFTGLDPIEVFAVEDRAAQLVWRDLPDGVLGAVVAGQHHELGDAGRAGAADLHGLEPDSTIPVDITVDGRVVHQRTIRTLPSLDGDPLTKIATINDIHLGESGFGLLKEMTESGSPAEGYPLRCARSAIEAAIAWGAELLVIKGDITDLGKPAEWDLVDEMLADLPIPVAAIPGNHDTVAKPTSIDPTIQLRARGLFPAAVHHLDLPGARLVLADTNVTGHSWGRLRRNTDALCAAVDHDSPAIVMLHHHLEAHPVPLFWPLGIPHRDGAPTVDAMLEANPDLLFSSGHTHRNRTRTHGTAVITEVGSTKDYPGVWAGYSVHTDGIRQTIRRVAEPSCIAWTDRTHAAVGGIWGRWSVGTLEARSFSHRWSRHAVSAPEESTVVKLVR